MRCIDLHTHSVYSDGMYRPAELISYAKEKGLIALSLTDHDTIDGLEEARKQASISDILFIDGVEINASAVINNKQITIHILGYLFDANIINEYMGKLKNMREAHNREIMNSLHAIGIDIDDAQLNKHADNTVITRMHFARALVEKGYAETIEDALIRYLHVGGSAYVAYNLPSFSEIINIIHNANGITSLAHPIKYKLCDFELERLLRELVNCGLDAIEYMYPSQDMSYTLEVERLAKRYQLAVTGGSDFHGNSGDGIDLGIGKGELFVPESVLTEIAAKKHSIVGSKVPSTKK